MFDAMAQGVGRLVDGPLTVRLDFVGTTRLMPRLSG
jgi:hypothetical protein